MTIKRKTRPAISPEAREKQLISMAYDYAEEQFLEGKASSQVVTHFLKLATLKEKLENDILEKKKELVTAQTEAMKTAKNIESLYEEAIKAMREYSGDDYE